MKLIKFYKNLSKIDKLFLIGCLVLLAFSLFIRFYRLSSIPLSFYHDEMDYVFTGEAVARWGTDASGEWSPWQFQPLKTFNYTAELPAVFHAAAQLIFGFGPHNGRVPAAAFGLFTVFITTALVYIQTKNWKLGLLTAILIASNPWHIHLSRMGYEAVISLFFQVSFITMVWVLAKDLLKKPIFKLGGYLALLLTIFLGFFTYHGAKFSYIALTGAACLWILTRKIPRIRKAVLITGMIGMMSILTFHMLGLQRAGVLGERHSEIVNFEYITEKVNEKRKTAFAEPYTNLVVNKPVVAFEELSRRYMAVFDLYRLGIMGFETGFQFSLIVHGFVYLSTIPLVIIGFHWWLKAYPVEGKFLLLFLLVSPFASMITMGDQSIFRSALTYLLLLVFAGGGAASVFNYLNKTKYPYIGVLAVFLVFMLEISRFGALYLSRYGIVSADNHYFFERLFARYESGVDEPIVAVLGGAKVYSHARALASYNQLMPVLTTEERMQFNDPSRGKFKIGQTTILGICADLDEYKDHIHVVDQIMFNNCDYDELLATVFTDVNNDQSLHSISSPIDSGGYYFLINDPVCDQDNITDFVYTGNIADYDLARLSDEEFCRTWVKHEL